jgi:hypothetical protein
MVRVTLALLLVPAAAAAEPTQIGAFFGPRIFSGKSSRSSSACPGCIPNSSSGSSRRTPPRST